MVLAVGTSISPVVPQFDGYVKGSSEAATAVRGRGLKAMRKKNRQVRRGRFRRCGG
jgi:hypothetical protein